MAFYTGHETLYNYITQPIPNGEHTFQTVAEGKSVDIEVEFYNFYDNVTYMENPILGDDVPNTKMLILKFWKNLTIGQFVTINPQVPKKGMLIYVMGDLHNKGIISMTGKGSNAEGQDVYLWKNSDGSFEYVPAEGASGAKAETVITNSSRRYFQGGTCDKATGRETGGGGSGALSLYCDGTSSASSMIDATSGSGGAGTSYSGGGGGGAVAAYNSANNTLTVTPARGANKNSGGQSVYYTSGSARQVSVIGGAGNPAGDALKLSNYGSGNQGSVGTAGLLLIYVDGNVNLDYGSSLTSIGVTNVATYSTQSYGNASGGSTGGGSINVFHTGVLINNGDESVKGGEVAAWGNAKGGAGGEGTVTIQQVSVRQNNIRFLNGDSKPIGQMDLGYAIQGAHSNIAKFTAESMYRNPIKNLSLEWEHAHDSLTTEPVLEFSKTLNPFVPENPITFEEVLEYRGRIEFYVRAKSGMMQTEQGRFAITATIEGA